MKKVFISFALLCVFTLCLFSYQQTQSNEAILPLQTEQEAIAQVIDGMHAAASRADLAAYLRAYTDDGVFMGTDDWERWSRPDTLDAYVTDRFKDGTGWQYTSVQRKINVAPEQKIAWFDEITVSPTWGRFRGTGVMHKIQGQWKIAHYSLSFLVPNEAWERVSQISQQAYAQRDAQADK
ncbi:MAG: nuclear transport factor 2 family protein [Paraglaciecola sp.]|nr:nuclear transport factor 2 family protein [Paraglaciecola sp.]NCT49029.1 nuclear transport factor 2 family protein [Paraglaciecola sp.]